MRSGLAPPPRVLLAPIAPDEAAFRDTGRGAETWDQYGTKVRHRRRPIQERTTRSMMYEFYFLKYVIKRPPAMRQWAVRDDYLRMDPGLVDMSPSLQAAYMRLFNSKSKGTVRSALRGIVPILEYRNTEEKQPLLPRDDPDQFISKDEPDTLNAKKRQLWERVDDAPSGFLPDQRFTDHKMHSRFRWTVRKQLMKFQRKADVANAAASRSVMYSEDDALGYFLYRGPAVYAGVHRALYELSKRLPWFVPKSLMDFGAGTGLAIQAAKEVYDPGSLAFPIRGSTRSARRMMNFNASAKAWGLECLKDDLDQLQRNNEVKKRERFMAVAALIDKGDIKLEELPADLRGEIAQVARLAAESAAKRRRGEADARLRELVDGGEWTSDTMRRLDDEADAQAQSDFDADLRADDDDFAAVEGEQPPKKKTWWERYVDDEAQAADKAVKRRLRPLQHVVAVEPSPGMMEIATNVLQHDVPDVQWKRYLDPGDSDVHDLVISAYTLSELASPEERRRAVQQLWRQTKGVLILIEHANLPNFDLLMDARDTILEHKDVGLWDWQPTIIGPCPHEKRCPLRHSSLGVRRPKMRVCRAEVTYRQTFVELWARGRDRKSYVASEPISYVIFARNELVPERADRRAAEQREAEAAKARARDEEQRRLYEASLSVQDEVFERVSDRELHRPGTDMPPPAVVQDAAGTDVAEANDDDALYPPAAGVSRPLPTDKVAKVQAGAKEHWLIQPKRIPPAQHRYNTQAFVDRALQTNRFISPSELLVVRSELNDIRDDYVKAANSYHRIVEEPRCTGKVTALMCTNEGELVRGTVYRRYVGDGGVTAHKVTDWQLQGGWRYLRFAKRCCMWPSDLPLYAVQRYGQVDFPNTLVNKKLTALQATAMVHSQAVEGEPLPRSDGQKVVANDGKALRAEEERLRSLEDSFGVQPSKREQGLKDREHIRQRAMEFRKAFGGGEGSGTASPAQFDSRAPIPSKAWSEAIRRAKRGAKKNL